MRRIIGATAVLGLFGLGCMTYDFQPVQPLAIAQTRTGGVIRAKKLKPNLMLLVDKSGSMTDPASAGGASKITELRNAMSTFLGQHGTVARMGLTFFPSDNVCGSSTSVAQGLPAPSAVDDAAADSANTASANAILAKINAVTPGGGTPTGNSLEFVGTVQGLNDPDDKRGDFVVLLTDGLPNCNSQNPNSCANPSACQCTLQSCGSVGSQFCTQGCLDQAGVVEKITALKAKNISTIVIGFGADTAGAAQGTLNAMAEAGGFPRACPGGTDGECGTNNSCDTATKLCRVKYYQSSSGTALADDLTNIGNLIGKTDPCVYPLDTTATLDPKFISVEINGQPVAQGPDTWKLEPSTNTIVFTKTGSTCQEILASTEQKPVIIDVRALEQL